MRERLSGLGEGAKGFLIPICVRDVSCEGPNRWRKECASGDIYVLCVEDITG